MFPSEYAFPSEWARFKGNFVSKLTISQMTYMHLTSTNVHLKFKTSKWPNSSFRSTIRIILISYESKLYFLPIYLENNTWDDHRFKMSKIRYFFVKTVRIFFFQKTLVLKAPKCSNLQWKIMRLIRYVVSVTFRLFNFMI